MANAQPILIFPFNGNGMEALDCLGESYRCVGFVDDTADKQGREYGGVPVLTRKAFADFPAAKVLAVPGGPASYKSRRQIISDLGIDASRFATVVHPAARVSRYATVGRNVLLMAGVVVTSNAVIGDHVCVLPNTVIHHDAVVGSLSVVGSNVTVAGNVTVEDNCYVGSGSSLKNGLRIGQGALIGLGSTVISPVARDAVVAGSPARQIR